MHYDANDLVALFAQTFATEYRTRLVGGGDEPFYRPAASADDWHEILFRHDYFQSALHEIAHWCVAGPARRLQPDFGYWYHPDGRTRAQQAAFERVEARPQAVEWVLTRACGKPFLISTDNLGSDDPVDEDSFWSAVYAELQRCLAGTLPPRAAMLGQALAAHYGQPWPLAADQFAVPAGFEGITSRGGANSSV